MVIRAIVHNGSIQPIDPLPSQFEEGVEVEVSLSEHASSTADAETFEAWYRDVVAAGPPPWDDEEKQRFDAAIAEHRERDKESISKQMGLQ